jgi:hypothetical protein
MPVKLASVSTIQVLVLSHLGYAKIGALVSFPLRDWKAFLQASLHWNLTFFFVSSYSGAAVVENPLIKRL